MLARGWGLDPELDAAELAAQVLEPARVARQLAALGQPEQAALRDLVAAGGSLPVAILQRTYGVVRDPSNFPDARSFLSGLADPSSPAERLYLLGLIVRHRDERGQVFRIPQEFLALLPAAAPPSRQLSVAVHPTPAEWQAGDAHHVEQCIFALLSAAYSAPLTTLDDGTLNKASITKVVARLRPTSNVRSLRREADFPWLSWVRSLAVAAGLLRRGTDGLLSVTPAALTWLALPAIERARQLLDGWRTSAANELTLLAGLRWRSTVYNLNLPAVRQELAELLATLPAEGWWRLNEIASAVWNAAPYLLRRDGRFDTWLVYDARGTLVAGEQHWDSIEGALICQTIAHPLHWLGLVDYAADADEQLIARWTPLGRHLLAGGPAPEVVPPEPIVVQSTFEVVCPPGASWYAQFQLGRIAEPLPSPEVPRFKLTRKATLAAAERGISGEDIVRFLTESSAQPVPDVVTYRVREWSGHAQQIVIESAALLRAEPVLLAELRRQKGLALPEVEELRPDLWRLPEGDAPGLVERLKAASYGVADQLTPAEAPLSQRDLIALTTAAYVYAGLCQDLQLPGEISTALLQRLNKLLPDRTMLAAQRTAGELLYARLTADRGSNE